MFSSIIQTETIGVLNRSSLAQGMLLKSQVIGEFRIQISKKLCFYSHLQQLIDHEVVVWAVEWGGE